jgi:agmatinase
MIFFSKTGQIALHTEGEPDWVLFGVPYDCTASFQPGARFGPQSIREASYALEIFDCDLEVDLTNVCINDLGDINVRLGDPRTNFEIVKEAVSEISHPFIALGGEHTMVYPLVSVVQPELCVILDAHLDLRDKYLGEPLSHACTARRVLEVCDVQVYGYRECSKEEYVFMKENSINAFKSSEISDFMYPEGKKLHLSIDLDVLDPCYAPHVSNPVPNGLSFAEVVTVCSEVIKRNTVVSMDICELTSRYADRTAVAAASLLYKILAVWLYERKL